MKLFWHEHNPWKDRAIYLPDLKELSAVLNPTNPERDYNKWMQFHAEQVDAYVLPNNNGDHSVGIRYGAKDYEYYSPYVNRYLAALLISKYHKLLYPAPTEKDVYRFYQCDRCGMLHPVPWQGHCNEAVAFSIDHLHKMHGLLGWRLVPNPHYRIETSCALES